MKTTVWVRLICALLMLCMMTSVIVGCQTQGEDPQNTKDPSQTNGTGDGATDARTDEDGYLLDNIPDDLKLNREIKILFSQHMKNDIAPEETSDNVVENAIYRRWVTVEERLGAELTWVPKDGQWNNARTEFFKLVETTSTTGDAFDAIIAYNLFPGALTQQGLLQNLGDTDYIDLTAPWWPDAFLDEVMINDVVYGLVENSAKTTMNHLHGTFFNNDLIEAHNMRDPYEMVAANEWTFDNMMAMIKDSWQDLNSNGIKDDSDFFGVVTGTEAKIETWFFAMGYRYSQRNTDGVPELLMGNSSKMTEWIDRFNVATDTNDFLLYDTKGHTKAFFEERAILYTTSLVMVNTMISQGLEMNYGVVPVPKGSEDQEKYISNVANHHAAWMVPIEAEDLQESSALIECMASESYRQIAPVYFDACVKLRYAPDERLADMYDLIRDTITFDFCQIYSFVFTVDPRKMITNCTKGTTQWASQWASSGAATETAFQQILTLYGVG
ncbi:MAG: hypothetical protein IJX28_03940 [Clostridia bacterium]|nr:hypothetical protein [Clostridia bacterium]